MADLWVRGSARAFLTARALIALAPFVNADHRVASALEGGESWLLGMMDGGGWGSPELSAQVLLALLPGVAEVSMLDGAVTALAAGQGADGSWGGSVLTTALALRALSLYQARSELPTSGSLTGSISGVVLSAYSGAPLDGVMVALDAVPGSEIRTDGRGRFAFGGLDAGSHRITVQRSGYQTAGLTLDIASGEVRNAGSVMLEPLVDRGVFLGRLTSALDGAAIAGAEVSLAGEVIRSESSNSDGRFHFGAVEPGNYRISLSAPGYATQLGEATVVAGGEYLLDATLVPEGTYDDAPRDLAGRVVDGDSGEPLTGASIELDAAGVISTDQEGRFLFAQMARGDYRVAVSAPGYRSRILGYFLASGVSGDLGTIALYPEAGTGIADTLTIEGRVIDGVSSIPIVGALVQAVGQGGGVVTDSGGGFLLGGLTHTSARLEVSAEGYPTHEFGVNAGRFGSYSVEFALTTGEPPLTASEYGVYGRVVDADFGQRLAGVAVSARSNGRTVTTITASDGFYALRGLDSSSQTLTYSLAGYFDQSRNLELVPGAIAQLPDLRLQDVGPLIPDLVVSSLNSSTVVSDPLIPRVEGSLSGTARNIGRNTAAGPIELLAYYDVDGDRRPTDGVDRVLGRIETTDPILPGGERSFDIPLSGALPFRDAAIRVEVDAAAAVEEIDERNNGRDTASLCRAAPPPRASLDLRLKWAWRGSPEAPDIHYVYGPVVVGQLNDDNGDGRIDTGDVPDLVFVAGKESMPRPPYPTRLVALSGADGTEIWGRSDLHLSNLGSAALGDIDGDGVVEILVVTENRERLIALENDGTVKWEVEGGVPWAYDWYVADSPAIADLDHDGSPEIILGHLVYNADGTRKWIGAGDHGAAYDGYGYTSIAADVDLQGDMEVIAGRTLYDSQGNIVWHRGDLPGDGFNAVGNFDDDDEAEIVLVAEGRVYVLEHTGETLWGPVGVVGGGKGGPPTVADFDGDGEPEISVAGARDFAVYETDSTWKWYWQTSDYSSTTTGSSLFDFDSDGRPEVLYADEMWLRIFDGETGELRSIIANSSGTVHEYPTVVDIDNDGEAEIILTANDGFGGEQSGVRVFEAADGGWAPTRSIWNQHSYHITNINDDGTIPREEAHSWLSHNTYRLNAFIDSPDTTALVDLSASMPGVEDHGSGLPVTFTLRVGNAGTAASPDGARVTVHAGAPAGEGGRLVAEASLVALEAGGYRDLRLEALDAYDGSTGLYAAVDSDDAVVECNEENNRVHLPAAALSASRGEIAVSPATAVYAPGVTVNLAAELTNTGGLVADYNTRLWIEDALGFPVAEFAERGAAGVAPATSVSVGESWDSTGYLAGPYRVLAVLSSRDGREIDRAEGTIVLEHPDADGPAATLRLTTDRARYVPLERVEIGLLARNVSEATLIDDARIRWVLRDAAGGIVADHTLAVGQLRPGGSFSGGQFYSADADATGPYRLAGELIDASDRVLAVAETTFEVIDDPLIRLTASLSAERAQLVAGEPQRCLERLRNSGEAPTGDLQLRFAFGRVDPPREVLIEPYTAALDAAGERLGEWPVATAGLEAGIYACVIQADGGDGRGWRTLASVLFQIEVPPIVIDATLGAADRGRLLVLLDDPARCVGEGHEGEHEEEGDAGGEHSQPADDHRRDHQREEEGEDDETSGEQGGCGEAERDRDPLGVPLAIPLSQQRAWLESRLAAAGWSYRIVTDGEAFAREQRSGAYSLYLLHSETVHLDTGEQKALREAIYGGDGLVVAGDHDRRNAHLTDVLGIEPHGTRRAEGVVLADGGSLGFAEPRRVIRVEGERALLLAHFIPGAEPALTYRAYGEGEASYIAFDLLAEATADGAAAAWGELLLGALDEVSPPAEPAVAGGVLPLRLTLTNQGITTPGVASLPLAAGIELLDGGGARFEDATLIWPFELAEAETLTLDAWLRLPETAGPLHLSAGIETGTAPDLLPYGEASWSLEPTPPTTLAEVEAALAASGLERNRRERIERDLRRVASALDRDEADEAVERLLRIADRLLDAEPAAHSLRLAVARLIGQLQRRL